jgi:hypothetical protein
MQLSACGKKLKFSQPGFTYSQGLAGCVIPDELFYLIQPGFLVFKTTTLQGFYAL